MNCETWSDWDNIEVVVYSAGVLEREFETNSKQGHRAGTVNNGSKCIVRNNKQGDRSSWFIQCSCSFVGVIPV